MAQILNFQKMEVFGASKEEALAQAPFNVGLPGADCTQAFRNYKKQFVGKPFTDSDMKQFMLEQLAKKTKNTEGNGCYIVLESAVADSRERPYCFTDYKNTEGTRKYVIVYQLIDDQTGKVIAETPVKQVQDKDKDGNLLTNEDGSPKMVWQYGTKAQAKEIAKELYINGYKGNITCRYTKQVVDGEPIAFKVSYAPSKNARVGRYLCFGIAN